MPAPSSSLRVLVLDSMLGGTGRHSVSQGEIVASLLREHGATVATASTHESPPRRLVDMVATVLRGRSRIDVISLAVYSGRGFWIADVPSRVARGLSIPVVLVLHGGKLPEYATRHPRRVRRLLGRATAVVAPSAFNAQGLGPYATQPIEVIPNLVTPVPTPGESATRPEAPRVLWMRSFEDIYAPEVALAAFSRLRATLPDATLTMAGPDKRDLLVDLRAEAQALGIADAVAFPGFLDPEAKREAFGSHHVFLNTSRIDNTPVSLLEAAGSGLPVVTTTAGGIPVLLPEGSHALHAPVDDADALAASLVRVLTEPGLRDTLVDNGRALVEGMTAEALGPRWLDFLADAATAR